VDEYSREAKVSVVFFWGALGLLFFGFKHFSDRAKILQSNKDNLPVWTRWWLAVLSHFKVFVL